MRTRTLTILMMIVSLMGAPLAQAGPHDRGHGHGHGHHDKHHHKKHYKKHHKHQERRHESRRDHHWRRGDHLPRHYYSDQRYWVKDWHHRHLSKPPRGHRWLNIDGRYVLAAVAGGAITAIILNR
ncbi:RcnB family protein [Cobetia sp. 10Alg 146]|uniref:RcnB family protein n=1 Tax=Cobetia sp. 10Alg 146 TaxID=3040019 RepID=UPI002449C713|nr:RcnB family protein [Cobetia sp. 10Alg 146]MDH2291428.1 RcnB family protein [Cobetia sp. 10Alg 146]